MYRSTASEFYWSIPILGEQVPQFGGGGGGGGG